MPPQKNSPSPIQSENSDSHALWERVSEQLRERLGEETFKRWFSQADVILVDKVAHIKLESDTHTLWVETNFEPELKDSVEAVLGQKVKLSFAEPPEKVGTEEEVKAPRKVASKKQTKPAKPTQKPQHQEVKAVTVEKDLTTLIKKSGLNPDKSFENYVVGSNNQFADAACRAIVSGVAKGYNPFFLHCPPGLGKTHLVQALGQEFLRQDHTKKVVYLTGEKFTNNYIEAVRKGTTDAFRRRYRKVDMLILDDIQFLAGKGKSQEEFFHTFNTLLETQGQVVLTSDRPANEVQTFDTRLSSRFEAGLTVSIAQPDFETRAAILQAKIKELQVEVPEDVIHFIAEKVKTNVRRLEGALARAATHCSLAGETLTLPVLEELLADILRQESIQKVTVERIQKVVAAHFDIRLADMTSRKRPANIAKARQIAMFLSREMTQNSLADIGGLFGGRDHGTVIHACKKIQSDLKVDNYIKGEIQFIRTKLAR